MLLSYKKCTTLLCIAFLAPTLHAGKGPNKPDKTPPDPLQGARQAATDVINSHPGKYLPMSPIVSFLFEAQLTERSRRKNSEQLIS